MTDDDPAGDFCGFAHPVLAVACPDCKARIGAMCMRPSGHRASDFHQSRKAAADAAFIARHGAAASIERTAAGWAIDPTGDAEARATDAAGSDLPLFAAR
ncbi:zinc finger domain-containing protein [Rubrimonas cliftonensis]|uniref:DNA-binding phage zinc finger domain-containing protein n=1 Tax=Rubrimonas cliftonensis TaxID=89524 RepID=A0A1H4EQB7_9RHOB|nr:hypothetical protein [Rubrimonas cliftonensis]SEA87294.1 hypothetical protein SAMN05444370_11542 [Rubrimonas cliftonensis]